MSSDPEQQDAPTASHERPSQSSKSGTFKETLAHSDFWLAVFLAILISIALFIAHQKFIPLKVSENWLTDMSLPQ
jgi:hypothetical protein